MIHLKIPPEQAIALLEERINAMNTLLTTQDSPGYYDIVGWMSGTYSAIDQIYDSNNIAPEEIRMIGLPACSCNTGRDARMLLEVYHSKLLDYIDDIRTFMQGKK